MKDGENNNPIWLINKMNGKREPMQDHTSDGTADPGELLGSTRYFGEKGFDLLRKFNAKAGALSLVPLNRLMQFLLSNKSEDYRKAH